MGGIDPVRLTSHLWSLAAAPREKTGADLEGKARAWRLSPRARPPPGFEPVSRGERDTILYCDSGGFGGEKIFPGEPDRRCERDTIPFSTERQTMYAHWNAALGRQFAAAVQMLRSTIEACPDDLWDERGGGSPFWHLAYHALFFTDLYLSDDEKAFRARDYHEKTAHFLPGDYKEFGGIVTTPEKPFTREQLLDYADHCLQKCDETFAKLTDERMLERCGFWWYELNVGEFLLNNLRHVQHHTGQLALLLRRHADIGIDWLGTRDNQPAPPTW